jgi:hypothetical protein
MAGPLNTRVCSHETVLREGEKYLFLKGGNVVSLSSPVIFWTNTSCCCSQGQLLECFRKPCFFVFILLQAWERLEKAEHERELALRNELIRQEKLEQLARRFDRKAAMRETWLSENQRLVSQVLSELLMQVFLR